jgi:uncharacterized protein YprB with RNaseH-like and TPR domain
MYNTYRGKYTLKNPEKYIGDPDNVVYRSLWERNTFRWCEKNPSVKKWSSESIIIPYYDAASNKNRRYFMDLWIQTTNGQVMMVEVKPHNQTRPPVKKGRKTKNYMNEASTYTTNQCKWAAAEKYAKERGWAFVKWTEKELKSMGIIKW